MRFAIFNDTYDFTTLTISRHLSFSLLMLGRSTKDHSPDTWMILYAISFKLLTTSISDPAPLPSRSSAVVLQIHRMRLLTDIMQTSDLSHIWHGGYTGHPHMALVCFTTTVDNASTRNLHR